MEVTTQLWALWDAASETWQSDCSDERKMVAWLHYDWCMTWMCCRVSWRSWLEYRNSFKDQRIQVNAQSVERWVHNHMYRAQTLNFHCFPLCLNFSVQGFTTFFLTNLFALFWFLIRNMLQSFLRQPWCFCVVCWLLTLTSPFSVFTVLSHHTEEYQSTRSSGLHFLYTVYFL